jgi:hypothetical protein
MVDMELKDIYTEGGFTAHGVGGYIVGGQHHWGIDTKDAIQYVIASR